MTSGDVFHKIRFLVIDKVGNAAYGFSESCILFYLTSYILHLTSSLLHLTSSISHLPHPSALHQTNQEDDTTEGQFDGHSCPNTWQSVSCGQNGC